MIRGVVLFLLLGTMLSGCESGSYTSAAQARLAGVSEQDLSVSGMERRYSGQTILDYSPQHGTQVAYLAPDGRAYLWYPGNRIALPGDWEARPDKSNPRFAEMCFRYGAQSFNPVTGQQGGRFECRPAYVFEISVAERATGDLFGLSSGTIPFVMPRAERESLTSLAERAR